MAYDLKQVGRYGSGSLGDVENPIGQINSYANVTAIATNAITIGAASNGIYEKFVAGTEILLHVSATNGTSQEYAYLGQYMVCKITAVSGSVLTLDKDFIQILPIIEFAKYQVQAITIAQFKKLTLSSGSISPSIYNITTKCGGICLFKCSDTFSQTGGSINLVDKGIPMANTAYRPLTYQEQYGNADTDKYSGWENHVTAREFLLNCGDGAVAFWAKKYSGSGTASRIGGTTAGAHFVRGNMGGSSILWVAEEIEGFSPTIISKTKGSGRGLGRCYIASKTKLHNDEGLYAYDSISDPLKLMRDLNIKDYGNGSLGDVINPTTPMNNYAGVTGISVDGKTIAYTGKTTNGMAQISAGSLVMFHVSKHNDGADMNLLGKFILAKVLSDDGNNMVLDIPVTKVFDVFKISKYNCQIISIAQINNLKISNNYAYTTVWNDSAKTGGLCAIAVKNLCDLRNGQINVENKGGGNAYGGGGLGFIGNSQMTDILPIGQGHGSVFLLVDNALMDNSTRIGALYSGAEFGGNGSQNLHTGGGYTGAGTANGGRNGGARGGGAGWNTGGVGGYASSGINGRSYAGVSTAGGKQGAHIFMVVNLLNIFSLTNFSTGGELGAGNVFSGYSGGSGYGGGAGGYTFVSGHNAGGGDVGGAGGYNGSGGGGAGCGGGGSSGWMFIHVNIIEEFNMTGVIA